jgi:uroporphyrinogen-III synthase
MSAIRHVLITRPALDSGPLIAACYAHDFAPLVSPLLNIVTLYDAVPDLRAAQAVVFTSANAVAAVRTVADIPCFAVGEKTGQAARDAGFRKVTVAGGDAVALNALLACEEWRTDRPVYHLSGREVSAPVVVPGVTVERHVVYHADKIEEFVPDAAREIASGAVAGVFLMSVRTGEAFVAAVEKAGLTESLRATKALCISDSVLQSVAQLPWRGAAVARAPDVDGLAALLADPAL